MKVDARMAPEPSSDRRTLMRAEVVEDQVERLSCRCGAIEPSQEAKKLVRPMATMTFPDHDAVEHPQRGVECRRAVTNIVVGWALRYARQQRQNGSGAIERLNATLFVDAKDHRLRRGIQIQPHDVAQLLDEPRIVRQLEPRDAMRLKAMLTPDLSNRPVAQAVGLRQGPATPVRRGARARRQRRFDDRLDLLRRNALPASRPRGIAQQPRYAGAQEPLRPQPHRHPTDVQRRGHRRRRLPIGEHQHNPSAERNFLRRVAVLGNLLQLGGLTRRGIQTDLLNKHAPPYQTGAALYSVFGTAISYSRD